MGFFKKDLSKRVGICVGFGFMYFLFTTFIYLFMFFFSKHNGFLVYLSVMNITLFIVLIGGLLELILK